MNCNAISDWKDIQKENKIFLFSRNMTFQLCSNQLSGNPETLQCLLVWGVQNYTRLIPLHWAPAKERAVTCCLDPPAIQLPRDSQHYPSLPKGDCQDFGDSSTDEWERAFGDSSTDEWETGALEAWPGCKEPRLPGRAECFKSRRTSAV